jgi:putative transposase
VTTCTRHRICCLGNVIEDQFSPSDLGRIVAEEWLEMARRRAFVSLDSWVVMPNHFHGLLLIEPPPMNAPPRPLGQIIGQFKASCTRRVWALGYKDFNWQSRYYDQILRDSETLLRFRAYIDANPAMWAKDRHHPDSSAIKT